MSSATKPGVTASSRIRLRVMSPDDATSTTASAVCATTSALRARWRPASAAGPRPAPRSTVAMDTRRARSSGGGLP